MAPKKAIKKVAKKTPKKAVKKKAKTKNKKAQRSTAPNPYRDIAIMAAYAAAEKKGVDITVLDLHEASDVADFVVIVSAESSAQLGALERSVEDELRLQGHRPIRRDGRPRDRWIAIDYGAVMVHLLLVDAREFYRLDHVWETAEKVKWDKKK
jgi:ribosome-associated protein